MDTWRLMRSASMSGAANMAIDQALADLFAATQQPTIRFYTWRPACLSIGLGQRLERDVDRAACVALGIDVVRRQTGGRAILHDREVTYSIVAPVDHALIGAATVVESYRRISAALCAGLRLLGVDPVFAPRAAHHDAPSAACFDQPGDYEITVGGRKLVGSAQSRRHGIVLQHGSILLHANPLALARVLRLPPTMQAADLAERMVALDEVLDAAPPVDQVVAALTQGFEQTWAIRLKPGDLTAAERARAVELEREKYGSLAWTARR